MTVQLILLTCHISVAFSQLQVYQDQPFLQDSSEKIPLATDLHGAQLMKVRCDRNGRILVLSDKGLLQIHEGRLKPDRLHRPIAKMDVKDLIIHEGQFVYLTDQWVLSNAWAGRLLSRHQVANVRHLAMGDGEEYMATNGQTGQLCFDAKREQYLVLTGDTLQAKTQQGDIARTFTGEDLTCFALGQTSDILIGTTRGYVRVDAETLEQTSELVASLPCPSIRCIRPVGDRTWFGTDQGAFVMKPDGSFNYYASRRWINDDQVVDIAPGPDNSVLILSQTGLNIIRFRQMTLAQKADHFDRLTRRRHVRYGFNSAFVMQEPGDLSTGTLVDQDNDGLWTAMYLAGELFRYGVTQSPDALRNCYESFEAMERLTQITPMPGFPARSFDRTGYAVADLSRWQPAADPNWTWKATTSSDEIVGHFFAYAIFAEIVQDPAWRNRAVALIDAIMDHIVRNNWYLVDFDGKPTRWGRWHPEYVNRFPPQVGDRRLNSVEIIAFLQTAFHFTHKEIYREKAFELMEGHGYLQNIMIPVDQIGRVPGINLTTEWNHSDDELAFLSYWLLYKYAFNETLQGQFQDCIEDHWRVERPEKNPLWDFIYASTNPDTFDLSESIWTLQRFPLDMIGWTVRNSHRKDLDFLPANFRHQTTDKVLRPGERPMTKYNGNAFRLDGGQGGLREFSGDIYLLPYWMGRYLGIIR